MELKATSVGQHLAQHPYNKVRLLHAGVEVSGAKHSYTIPFNQLYSVQCKRGIVWGELEFCLADDKVVRLHGTEWRETQEFYRYLMQSWQSWGNQVSQIAADVLASQAESINEMLQKGWVKYSMLTQVKEAIHTTLQTLPLPEVRLREFENCKAHYELCQQWLNQSEQMRSEVNQKWVKNAIEQNQDFFQTIETQPLNESQSTAVVNGEDTTLVLAGAGSGKTSVLVAKAGWLLRRQEAQPEQILLLAFGRQAAEEMNTRILERLGTKEIQAKTFHALALHIIQHSGRTTPSISRLEIDDKARRSLLSKIWQTQCKEKKVQAKGWRQWLEDELGWKLKEGEFWQDKAIVDRISGRLERWLGLMRMHGGTQAEMIAQASDENRELFQKQVKLMAPLLKAWKSALKEEGAVDFSGLIHQAINLLDKGKFTSPWRHILVDEFQDISPQRAALLMALRRQQTDNTALFAVGDDWQAIYRFSGAELSMTTAFEREFGIGDLCTLDVTYRFHHRIGEIANRFIQQNPYQLKKPLNSLSDGDKKSVVVLPEAQLEALLDKLSGFTKPDERVLVLARYHHLRPKCLAAAKTRWPMLHLDFATIHASKGQQADYVIIVGLHEGQDGFPAPARESVFEQVLLPVLEDYPDAEERRLLYVALTRAKSRVWLFYNPDSPSVFIEQLERLGVPLQRKP